MLADNDYDALWRHFTSPQAEAAVDRFRAVSNDEALAVLDVSEVEAGPSFVGPVTRFFIVQLEQQGRRRRVYVKAAERTFAGCSAMERYPFASAAKVVREISREEFERLTDKGRTA